MSDQTITIPVSGTTTVSAQLEGGTTIANQSSSEAVWVSSLPSVGVNNGVRIGPLGSLQWQGGPCYCIVESGSNSVNLSLSSSVAQLSSPLDVATALSQNGIPNTLIGAMIPGVVSGTPFDASKYASVSGIVNIPSAGYLLVQFMDPTLTVTIYQKYYTFGAKYTGWNFSTPVYGPQMAVYFAGAGGGGANLNPSLYGSNRTITEHCTSEFSINASLNQGYSASSTYAVGSPISTNGGLASFNIRCTPAVQTAKGNFGYQYWSLNAGVPGQLLTQNIIDTTQMHVDDSGVNYSVYVNDVTLPAGVIQPIFFAEAAISSGIVVFTGMVN